MTYKVIKDRNLSKLIERVNNEYDDWQIIQVGTDTSVSIPEPFAVLKKLKYIEVTSDIKTPTNEVVKTVSAVGNIFKTKASNLMNEIEKQREE